VAPIDYQEVARAIAPLLRPSFIEARRTIIEEVKAIVPQMVAPAIIPVPQIEAHRSAQNQAEHGQPEEETEAERDARLEAGYQDLRAGHFGKRVSGRALADKAHANRTYCTQWLKVNHPENEAGATSRSQHSELLSVASEPETGVIETEPELVGATLLGTESHDQSHLLEPPTAVETTPMEPKVEVGAIDESHLTDTRERAAIILAPEPVGRA
jgi:hypothetical protein